MHYFGVAFMTILFSRSPEIYFQTAECFKGLQLSEIIF